MARRTGQGRCSQARWALSFVRPYTSAQVEAREPLGVTAPTARLTSLRWTDAGLTGLLNPTSVLHKTISVVFPKALPSSFVYLNGRTDLDVQRNADGRSRELAHDLRC
jgi:hypothetical protein